MPKSNIFIPADKGKYQIVLLTIKFELDASSKFDPEHLSCSAPSFKVPLTSNCIIDNNKNTSI
jgi:hypothetical protein